MSETVAIAKLTRYKGRLENRDGSTEGNEHWFLGLEDAKQKIEDWRVHYNTQRPHSALNGLSPEEFVKYQKAG